MQIAHFIHPSERTDRRVGYHVDSKGTWGTLPVAAVAAEHPDLSGPQRPPDE